jgi:hypothetical protein
MGSSSLCGLCLCVHLEAGGWLGWEEMNVFQKYIKGGFFRILSWHGLFFSCFCLAHGVSFHYQTFSPLKNKTLFLLSNTIFSIER